MAKYVTWPWAVGLPLPEDQGYPAEMLRAKHSSSTSGGNGVSSPDAMKVMPQPAPDGTVRLTPGGADIVSTYEGHVHQSYYSHEFGVTTLTVPPTGSASGGRTDLVIRRLCDPDFDVHPNVPADQQGDISPELAATLDIDWYELLPGHDESTNLPYPHVKLAKITRPANTTIVTAAHITDLRELSDPQTRRIKLAQNVGTRVEVPRTGTGRLLVEFLVKVPDWATHAAIDASIGGAYFRGASGRGRMGIAAFNNSSLNEGTPWWEEGGSVNGFRRIPYIQAGRQLHIGENYRGTVAQVLVQGVVDTWSDNGFIFGVDAGARAFLDIDFMQGVE